MKKKIKKPAISKLRAKIKEQRAMIEDLQDEKDILKSEADRVYNILNIKDFFMYERNKDVLATISALVSYRRDNEGRKQDVAIANEDLKGIIYALIKPSILNEKYSCRAENIDPTTNRLK